MGAVSIYTADPHRYKGIGINKKIHLIFRRKNAPRAHPDTAAIAVNPGNPDVVVGEAGGATVVSGVAGTTSTIGAFELMVHTLSSISVNTAEAFPSM